MRSSLELPVTRKPKAPVKHGGGTRVMRVIKLLFPVPVHLHSGYGKLIFVIILPFFAIFKNAVYSLESGETPSNSASHQAPNYEQRS